MEISFAHPEYLWLLAIVPVLIMAHFTSLKQSRKKALNFANFEAISRVLGTRFLSKNIFLMLLRAVTISALILSISGLTIFYTGDSHDISVVLALDISGSMLADDYEPNRLGVEKEAAQLLLKSIKPGADMGIVSFTGLGFLDQPLTDDISGLTKTIDDLRIKRGEGTAIGSAIVTSVNTLVESKKAKMIVLVTDGQSNVGYPLEDAVNYSIEKKVVINTIGIGSERGGKITGVEPILGLNETSLINISTQTGGRYMRLKEPLSSVYFENFIEKTEKNIPIHLSVYLLLMAIGLLIIDLGLQNTKFKIIPS